MERNDKRHMDETLNIRSFYLRLLKKIWIIPLAAVIGALLGIGIYTLVTVTFGPAKSYSTETKLYLKFAYDEKGQTQVDSYNAYTWKLLIATDDIINETMNQLEKAGFSEGEISRQEVIDSVTAEIPSDVRLLLITITNNSREHADQITPALNASLEKYGKTNDAFDSITILSTTDASLVTYTDRSQAAAIFGALAMATLCIFVLLMMDILDDAVYVPEDCAKRYDIPVLGVLFKNGPASDEFFKNELQAAYEKDIMGKTNVCFISSDSIKDASNSKADLEALKSALADRFKDHVSGIIPMEEPGNVLDNYRKIGTSDGVIIAIPAGKKYGTMTEHLIAQLEKHECPILGIVLTRADENFMRKYYRIR